jgi:hypothetical protein
MLRIFTECERRPVTVMILNFIPTTKKNVMPIFTIITGKRPEE